MAKNYKIRKIEKMCFYLEHRVEDKTWWRGVILVFSDALNLFSF